MTALTIQNAAILQPTRALQQGDIRIVDDLIEGVGGGLAQTGDRLIDATGMVAMPGFINAHTHSGQHLDRGVTPNLPLDLWLAWTVMGGLPLDPDDTYTAAAAGAIEMVTTGCTSVLDHVYIPSDGFEAHVEALTAAYDDVGIRAAIAPMLGDLDLMDPPPVYLLEPSAGAQRPPPVEDPGRLENLMTGFLAGGTPGLVTRMLGPSAPQRCSDDYLRINAELAKKFGVGIHTHALETKAQRVASTHLYGMSLIEFLDRMGLLGPRTSLAHAIWVTDEDIETLRRSNTTVVHNPISNLRTGSGVMPLRAFLDAGVAVGLGADGAASNDNQNMFEALKYGTLIHTLQGLHNTWPTPGEVWSATLKGGATAIGVPVGVLEPGFPADLVLVRGDRHAAPDGERLLASLAYAELGTSVSTTIVGGRVVAEAGLTTLVDAAAVTNKASALQKRIHDHHEKRTATYAKWEAELTEAERLVDAVDLAPERRVR